MNSDELRGLLALKNNLPLFAEHCLKIQTKDVLTGSAKGLAPLRYNPTQLALHNDLERIKKERGIIRAVIVKARQMGVSTYTTSRFYHKELYNTGVNTFIVSESDSSTASIFEMVKRYDDNFPRSIPKPPKRKSNEKALIFDSIDCYYRVGTAANENVGVGTTNHFVHASEVGLWKNAESIARSLFQTVSDDPSSGTEILLESTARGRGNYFYDRAMEGRKKGSVWTTLFYPWFLDPRYKKQIDDFFDPDEEAREIQRMHNLTDEQIYWYVSKFQSDFGEGREDKFHNEYPNSIQEAFAYSGGGLIPARYLEAARLSTKKDTNNGLIVSCDPAREGGDRTVFCFRRGKQLERLIVIRDEMTHHELVGRTVQIINDYNPDMVFFDYAKGEDAVDTLNMMNYRNVIAVQFASRADNQKKYVNKRAEMYDRMRNWFIKGASIPDNNELIDELAVMPDLKIGDSNGRFIMMKKEQIKKDITNGVSPDIADALALSFAYEIKLDNNDNEIKVINRTKRR